MPFHLIQRGHNRAACFGSDQDRYHYLNALGQLSRAHGVAVHAYVLMTNHVHLLATPAQADGIETLMKPLGQTHAQYFNRTYSRVGALWAGRYRACLVDAESYLLTCHRYIECNPVRAGMARHPDDYRWSSHRANAHGDPNALLTLHPVVEALGTIVDERCASYRALFDHELAESELQLLRSTTSGGFALGSPEFLQRISQQLRRRTVKVGSGRWRHQKGSDPF